MLLGASRIANNRDFIRAARCHFRGACLIWKPHPDAEAGLRRRPDLGDALSLVDHVADDAAIAPLLQQVDHVCTITSLTGFEALMYDKPVTCFGRPFYAGWGMTEDLARMPRRRHARPTLDGFVHAALIDYPMYWDPVTGQSCPVEVVLERFAAGQASRRQPSWPTGFLERNLGGFRRRIHRLKR